MGIFWHFCKFIKTKCFVLVMDSLRVLMLDERFSQKILCGQNADMFVSNLLAIARYKLLIFISLRIYLDVECVFFFKLWRYFKQIFSLIFLEKKILTWYIKSSKSFFLTTIILPFSFSGSGSPAQGMLVFRILSNATLNKQSATVVYQKREQVRIKKQHYFLCR